MHAERGFTTERRSGTRAATTFRKLPMARPGARAKAASAASTPYVSPRGRPGVSRRASAGGSAGRTPPGSRHPDRNGRDVRERVRAHVVREDDLAAHDRPVGAGVVAVLHLVRP